MKRRSLYFRGDRRVEVRRAKLAAPAAGQLLVGAICSGISGGTELLFYRGEVPGEMLADASIPALQQNTAFPLRYGYALAGEVLAAGSVELEEWVGRKVFAFHPHESHFLATPDQLHPIPPDIEPESAVLLPNMETAVNLLLDGRPLLGERVLVLGQGIVGLLVAFLLARYPLSALVTADGHASRREVSCKLGAMLSVDPGQLADSAAVEELFSPPGLGSGGGADLIFELSGNPAALDLAIARAGYDSRIVIGSWYGSKLVSLDLGGRFHRNRIRLISSQVSTLAPARRGRWDHARRLKLAWEMLALLPSTDLITHRFPLEAAGEAYRLLDENPAEALQVVLTYNGK